MNLGRSRTTAKTGAAAVSGGKDTLHEKAKLAFNAYDRNRDGFLTKAELKKTSKKMTEAQIEAVFEKYDRNKDGKLDFEEFKDLMESNRRLQQQQEQPPPLPERLQRASSQDQKD